MSCALPDMGKHATKVNILFGTTKGKDKKMEVLTKLTREGYQFAKGLAERCQCYNGVIRKKRKNSHRLYCRFSISRVNSSAT